MNARENALRILHFDHPERVVSYPPIYGLQYHGANHEGFEGGGDDAPVGTRWLDVWGTGWHKEMEGVMGFPRYNPLAEPKSLNGYRWPDPDDERICRSVYEQAEHYPGGDLLLAGRHRDQLWEQSYMLVGMENMMVYFHTEPEFVREVLHRIMDFHLGMAKHYLSLGVEFVNTGDDLGTQRAPLLSPSIIQEFLVPEYRRLFDLYRQRGVLMNFHSCGHVHSLLGALVDMGVHVLNPVQASANDLKHVRSVTRGRLALQGGVSSATVMDGPPERIAREVAERIWQLGRDGGYFCGPDQALPFPQEHVDALKQAVEAYGRYPLARPHWMETGVDEA